MAYTIYNTDGTTLLLLADNTVDQSATSLSLVGKNVNGYGQYMNNNFVKLLANSASSAGSPPRSPLTGQLWFDTTSRRLNIYDGSFKPVTGASISGRDTPPANPVSGDLWYDSTYYQLKLFYGAVWYIVGPAFPASIGENGWILPTGNVQDKYLNNQQVTLMKNYGQTLGVISSATFTTTYFTTATTLLTTSTTDVVRGLTVFGTIQATKNVKVYNTLTSDTIVSAIISNTNVISTVNLLATNFSVSGTATSTSTTTGAIVVSGGVGIGGSLYIGKDTILGPVAITNTTFLDGVAWTLPGGAEGVSGVWTTHGTGLAAIIAAIKGLKVGDIIQLDGTPRTVTVDGSTTDGDHIYYSGADSYHTASIVLPVRGASGTSSTSISSGALVVNGGAGIGGDLYVGGKVVAQELDIQYTTVTTVSIKTDDVFTTYNTTNATSTITGAIVVSGGIGVAKSVYVGDLVTAVSGLITNLTATNITVTTGSMATLTVTNITVTKGLVTTLTATNLLVSNTATITKDVIASGIGYVNNSLVVGSTGAEGGQIVIGWAGINGIQGQSNSTWNVDVDGSNNFRIFSQDGSSLVTTVLTANTATSKVTFGGSVDMGKVLTLTLSTAAPANPVVGMFAVADRVTWDPATKGSGNAYPVFYNGSTWNALY